MKQNRLLWDEYNENLLERNVIGGIEPLLPVRALKPPQQSRICTVPR